MTVRHALEVDKETGTDLRYKAIEKEMKHVLPAFEVLEGGEKSPIASK